MSSDRPRQQAYSVEPVEVAAWQWRELYKAVEELKESTHPGANFLSFYRDQMVFAEERLLKLGLDISDHRNPRVVPVPVALHPKTKAEARRWEAEITLWSYQFMLSFSVAGAGASVVYSAVGDEPLVEVLASYASKPAELTKEDLTSLVSRSNLKYQALACSLWLLEPVGPMASSAADLDRACFDRMLYAFELNPLIRNHISVRNSKESEADRLAASNAVAGWSLANLSLKGTPGGALRHALGAEASPKAQYERLVKELPTASLIAWEDRVPEEPLRSTGKRQTNLARRIAAILEKVGNEDTTRLGKLTHQIFGTAEQEEDRRVGQVVGEAEPLLEEFECQETARQELKQLRTWVENAGFSGQEKRVYEADMRTDCDTAAIANELGMPAGQVRVVRGNYRKKIRKVADSRTKSKENR